MLRKKHGYPVIVTWLKVTRVDMPTNRVGELGCASNNLKTFFTVSRNSSTFSWQHARWLERALVMCLVQRPRS